MQSAVVSQAKGRRRTGGDNALGAALPGVGPANRPTPSLAFEHRVSPRPSLAVGVLSPDGQRQTALREPVLAERRQLHQQVEPVECRSADPLS